MQIDGEIMETFFLDSKITVDGDLQPWIKRGLFLGRKAMTNLEQRHHFANKGPYSQSYGFFSSHVWMWELDHKEGWALKNWCFLIELEKTLESPLDNKKIKPVNPKGNQLWIFIGRTVAEAAAPILWPTQMQRANSLKKTLCWEILKSKGEGGSRGWDG